MFDIEAIVGPATREALFAQVRRHTGIVMAERKWTLLHGRLRRRLQELQLPGYDAYLAVLDASTQEVARFIDLVTTNETSFFRTPRIWQHLTDEFFPGWYAANAGATMNIWSAAASTGEEAYSLAMLADTFQKTHADFRYRILGTDIAQGVLDIGVAGTYTGRNAEALRKSRPGMVDRYFERHEDAYRIVRSLRTGITFRQHNLYRHLPDPTRFDLVLLRNVLIYFDEAGQQDVVENVRHAMAPDAVLVIGESESLHRLTTGFTYQQPLIYRNTKPAA
jgi:chemotaxis protein methyltransferase CheR